jgi:putative polymerase
MVRVINNYRVEILVFLFVTFNALLCVSLGFGVPVNNFTVVLCQAFLFCFLCYELIRVVAFELIDVVLIFSFFLMIILSFYIHEDMTTKDVFSVLVLPFSILYLRRVDFRFWLLVKVLFWLATVVLFFEVFLPEVLISFFPVGEYFLSTRDWVASQDAALDSMFYVGAVRPGGYYFIPDVHRVGSIFLEPLTYSYFLLLVIISARLFEPKIFFRVLYILVSLIAVILTDSRVGMLLGVILCFIPLKNFKVYISVYFYLLVIFFIMCIAWLLTEGSTAELPLRLSYTFNAIIDSDVLSVMGVFPMYGKVNDSGYLLYFSILGIPVFLMLILWLDNFSYQSWARGEGAFHPAFYLMFFVSLFFGGAILSAKIIVLMSALITSLNTKNLKSECL